MSHPIRVQLSRKRGWRMPANTMSVARPGRWGNPFRADLLGASLAVEMFADQMNGFFSPGKLAHLTDNEFQVVYDAKNDWLRRLNYGAEIVVGAKCELAGKNLACWCPLDAPCHADVLLRVANSIVTLAYIYPDASMQQG